MLLLASASGLSVDCRGLASDWIEASKRELLELESVTTSDQRVAAVDDLISKWEDRRITAMLATVP
jgi:hypothetical protein